MTYLPPNTPSNGSAAPDPNVVPGWTVQSGGPVTTGIPVVNDQGVQTGTDWSTTTDIPGVGYAQQHVGAVPSFFGGNGMPGAPGPIANTDVTSILANPGYADVNVSYLTAGVVIPASLVPVPASGTAVANPTSMDCTVVITGTVTSVQTATYGGMLAVATANDDGSYTVPAGGQIELTYTTVPTWTWTTARTVGAA